MTPEFAQSIGDDILLLLDLAGWWTEWDRLTDWVDSPFGAALELQPGVLQ